MKRSTRSFAKISKFYESVHQELNTCAVVAVVAVVSVLALAPPSEAKVVYTPVNIRIEPNQNYNLDLNHDGVTDFTIRNVRTSCVFAAVVEQPASGNSVIRSGSIDDYFAAALMSGAHAAPLCNSLGGGIYNVGTLAISNSTISGNQATTTGGGGGIYGTATLQNSIVANSTSGGNCGGTMTSNGYNLSSDGTCNFNDTGDLNNTDPKLGQLGNHGGPTQTIPLLSGSPAIDAGNPSGCTDGNGQLLKTDQRGEPRPDREDKSGCDMGAYEEQSQPKCIPLGDPCFGPGPLKCCPAFGRHTFCSSKTGYGHCLIDSLDPIKPL